jgi:hypothetical protein
MTSSKTILATGSLPNDTPRLVHRLSSEAAARLPPVAELEFWG